VGQQAERDEPARNPFPVAPADVPAAAVSAVKRTLLRNDHPSIEDPMDDELARLVVAVVIAALRDDDGSGRKPPRWGQGDPSGIAAPF
jgi:hypothetical protein